jgi:hypothetical protein
MAIAQPRIATHGLPRNPHRFVLRLDILGHFLSQQLRRPLKRFSRFVGVRTTSDNGNGIKGPATLPIDHTRGFDGKPIETPSFDPSRSSIP